MNKLRLILLPLALGLAACGPAPSDRTTPVADQTAPAETATAAPQPAATRFLHVSPARLDHCKRGQEVEVSWDLGSAFPGVTGVEIFVGPEDQQKLFSAGGAKGQTKTGPWTKPGTIFRLKNKKTGEEIERLTMQGPASC
jgi:hypothetical protein